MAEYKKYINALKKCAKEHENDNTPFANIRTTDLCNDTADLLERLEIGINKAIEEIRKLPDEYCDNYVGGAIDDVLCILEKNIGEQKCK